MNRVAKRKVHKRRSVIRRKPVSIIRVQPAIEKPWELRSDQIAILKNSICKGASDDELQFCLEVARRYKLDPFRQQIWFIPRWDKNADAGNGARGRNVYVPHVSIYGLLHMAARDHRDFGSLSEPEYGPMIEIDIENHKFKAPEWCRIKAFKKGIEEPSVAKIYFEEFCPRQWENVKLFWARMPRNQIAKCCKALVIKATYPDLGGVYIPEECERINEDFTDSGREITVASGVGSKEAAQEVGKKRIAELQAKIETRKQGSTEPRGLIELNWSKDEASPVVRGDISEQLETMKLNMHMTWEQDNAWHCEPRDAETLRVICQQLGCELKEILPDKFPAAASNRTPEKATVEGENSAGHPSTAGSKGKQDETVSPATGNSGFQPATATNKAKGKEIPTRKKKTRYGLPNALIPFVVKAVKWTPSGKGLEITLDTGAKLYAFDNRKMGEDGEKLLDLIAKEATGRECIFMMTKNKTKGGREFTNVITALQIGEREWDEQGVPILRRDPPYGEQREPGEE